MAPESRPPERRIFIGDVQGCREELERLLERLAFDPTRDRLRPVGDLVNRGPDSLGALRLLRDLDAWPVLGNHDLHLLGLADGTRRLRRDDTLAEVLDAPDREELLAWLRAQPLLRVDEDLFQVHAGLSPAWDDPARVLNAGGGRLPSEEAVRFATRVRRCDARGRMAEDASDSEAPHFRPWFEHYEPRRHGGRRVVFGHWAVRGLVQAEHVLGLDTGCVWGGRLTAWVAEEDRLVSVPAVAMHCRPG